MSERKNTQAVPIFLAVVILLFAIYGAYFVGLMETLGSVFFMAIGLRIISQFLKNEDIALGVSEITRDSSYFLRVSMFILGVFLYCAGPYHLLTQ